VSSSNQHSAVSIQHLAQLAIPLPIDISPPNLSHKQDCGKGTTSVVAVPEAAMIGF
jgi:hypothetical protein